MKTQLLQVDWAIRLLALLLVWQTPVFGQLLSYTPVDPAPQQLAYLQRSLSLLIEARVLW